MAFPSSPTNGQQAVVNGITYQYNASRHSWIRLVSGTDTFVVNNIVANSNISAAAYYWANGQPFASSSYGNVDVAAYLGPYYTYANANAATQATGINTINANLGSFQIWANTNYGTSSYANANVAAYLLTYTGNIAADSITLTGNIVGGGVRSTTSASAPATPTPGDIWYNTVDQTTLRYTYDGSSRFWLDIGGPSLAANAVSVSTAIAQSTAISALNANVTAANAAIVTTNSAMVANVTAANAAISVLQSNAASQATTITALSGNVQFTVTNSGASSYLIDGVANPTISLIRGITYTFNIGSTGHPFWIKTAATTGTSDAYSTGVTNNGSDSGTITFAVPLDAPDLLYYICQFHGTMKGNINIIGSLTTVGGDVSRKANIASPVFTGTVTAPIVSITGNLTVSGNILQQQAYYETYGNITNTGGNLTCNFNNGAVFYVTSLTANATASFTNVNALTNSVTATTLIIDQGVTAYKISNIQINGVNQTIRWVGTTAHTGTASNTDIVSFSFIHLGGGVYRVLGQSSSFG